MSMDFSSFKRQPKALPVILVLDTSGSMSWDRRIDVLNDAVKNMIADFKKIDEHEVQIKLSVWKFGGTVEEKIKLQPVENINYQDLVTGGDTPMGLAIKTVSDMINDKEIILSRDYAPNVILLSDGSPTDSYKKIMDDFMSGARTSKTGRFAIGIGDYKREALERFVQGTDFGVLEAKDAIDIRKLFKFITMTITTRIKTNTLDKPMKKEVVEDAIKVSGVDPSEIGYSGDLESLL